MVLAIGDFVRPSAAWLQRTPDCPKFAAVVVEVEPLAAHICYVGSSCKYGTWWHPYNLTLIFCRSCGRPHSAHTRKNRCLFGASTWKTSE